MEPHARPLLLLWGFMGSGKSTVGRAVAARAAVPFVDLDDEIAREAGMPVSAIFDTHGEAAFRVLERNALERLLDEQRTKVVALGGGALIEPELRRRALAVGFVITLNAPLEVLLERVDQGSRPLLRGDAPTRAQTLLEARAAAYAEAHATIDTGELSVGRAVQTVLNAWSGWR